MEPYSYEAAEEKVLEEVVREAESLLSAQLTAAIAADQRALTLSGLLAAAVAALLGFGETAAASIPTLISATLLTAAAGCALWSARPTPWQFAGNRPAEWQRDIAGKWPLHRSLAEMAAHYEGGIERNYSRMDSAKVFMCASLSCTAAALVVILTKAWWPIVTG